MNNATSGYQPLEIEARWRKRWREDQTYVVDLAEDLAGREKFYGFGMFNYPSGTDIHVGHVKNFTIPDVLLRFKRQRGAVVYSPVGFDSFGLPAENHALKTGTPPRQTTDTAIANYSRQYEVCGFSFDWSKVIDTSQPIYYRWTQWCFLRLYQAGLAYRQTRAQWWCSLCVTVLADEQVINGRCWRHDDESDPLIGHKNLKQWFFKITDYADDILKATDDLDWTPWVKIAQKNYIGRSEGYEVQFKLEGLSLSQPCLAVFTTAIETIEGATFMVLSPEHPLMTEIMEGANNADQLKAYVELAGSKSEVARQQGRDKTGVRIEGLTARNPATDEEISLWVADYVLVTYGTGAIMAVPGNDQRDYDFAKRYQLPVIYTTQEQEFVAYKDIAARPDQYYSAHRQQTMADSKKTLIKKLKAGKLIQSRVNYRLRDWLISRQRYWGAPIPIIYCKTCGTVPVPEEDLPVELPQISDYQPSGDGRSPLAKATEWLVAPCPKCGQPAERETDTMDGYVCSSWYQFRYLTPHSKREPWRKETAYHWLPVDFYNGADHATAHLLYARFFARFFYRQKLVPDPEPFARMYLHAKILAPDGQFFSKSKGNGINPLEVIERGYGADALRIYLCYAAPPDVEVAWDHHGLPAAYRFLRRVWSLVNDYLQQKYVKPTESCNRRLLSASHRCLAKNNHDLPKLKYNTALAAQMELVNTFYTLAAEDGFQSSAWQSSLEILVMLLAPFAPHLASELWHKLGHTDSVHLNHWPTLDEGYLIDDKIVLPVQINGRLRGQVTVRSDLSEEEVVDSVRADAKLSQYLQDCQIKKTIYIPGRIINFVTES